MDDLHNRRGRRYSGVGGTLTLMADGDLYGSGWDLTMPYGVDYDPAAAMAAPPVWIAGGVISAAAGYNYGLYVTADGTLRFIGSSGIPYAERFSFDGSIREIFAVPDRDVFRLKDEAGEQWVWGDNLSGELQATKITPLAVLDGQTLLHRRGRAVWRYEKDGAQHLCKWPLLEVPGWEALGELRRRVSEYTEYRRLSETCGENNLLLKYIRRSESDEREVRSDNWSEEAYEQAEGTGKGSISPRRPGAINIRMEAWCGTEKESVYTVGIYTVNRYLFRPVKE